MDSLSVMQNVIIETKLAPPRYRGRLVQRESLLNRLAAARHKQVALIHGPAGYGKTTLVALWRQDLIAKGHDVAWYYITSGDDLAQFMIHMAAALDRTVSGIGEEALTLLNRDSEFAVDEYLALLVNAIHVHSREIYLVLDDFHLIDSREIERVLSQLLKIAPANFHLVLVTRSQPRIDLAGLRVHGRIMEVEFAELRLNFDEAAEFISLQNVALERRSQRVVYELADGWIAGLQLLCIALRRDPDPGHLITTRLSSLTDFSDYLNAETLNYLGEEELQLLVTVSACRKFNEDLGCYLSGDDNADKILERAVTENLFLIPLESTDNHQWYRFHPLMEGVLHERLAARDIGSLEALNKKACQWFIDKGMVNEAIRHAIYARDFALAAEMISACGRDMTNQGQLKTLLSWGEQIPDEYADAVPEMQIPIIWALILCHRSDEAQEKIDLLRNGNGGLSDTAHAQLDLQTASICFLRDQTAEMLETVALLLGQESALKDPFIAASVANLQSGGFNQQGRYGEARDVQLGFRKSSGRETHLLRWLLGECFIGQSFALQGDMVQAERSYRDALSGAEKHVGFFSDPACMAISYLAEVLYETGRWDEAHKLISERLDVIERVALPYGIMSSYLSLARIEWRSGHPAEARAYLEGLEDIGLDRGLDRLVAAALQEMIRFNLEEGHLSVTDELMRRLQLLGERYPIEPRCATSDIPAMAQEARIRYELSMRNWTEALELISALLAVFKSWQQFKDVARLQLLAASTLAELGRMEDALEMARQSLLTGQRLGLLRTMLDEGENAHKLAQAASEASDSDPMLIAYVQKLNWDIESSKPQVSEHSEVSLESPIEELSVREFEILALLLQSLTNKKIAISLGVTHETVKWHLKNIYGKLGVGSRDEAVARARDLNLIQ